MIKYYIIPGGVAKLDTTEARHQAVVETLDAVEITESEYQVRLKAHNRENRNEDDRMRRKAI